MNTWHARPPELRAWVDGDAGMALGASIEQHLIGCPDCRRTIAEIVGARTELRAGIDTGRDRLLTAVQVPRPGPLHRLLARIGMPAADLQAVRSTTTPRLIWLLGTILTLAFVTIAAVFGSTGDGAAAFLAVAPLVPTAGVALLYGPRTDPTYELLAASPYPVIRMVLLRTLVVLVCSVPGLLVAGLVLPIPTRVATVWLLPAAGCIVAVLAAATWVDIERAAAGAALLWLAVVVIAARRGAFQALLDPAAIEVYLTLALGAGLVLALRVHTPQSAHRLR